jgi:hypothetical protein
MEGPKQTITLRYSEIKIVDILITAIINYYLSTGISDRQPIIPAQLSWRLVGTGTEVHF